MKPVFCCVSFYPFLVEDDSGSVEQVPVHQANDFFMIMKMIDLRMGQ